MAPCSVCATTAAVIFWTAQPMQAARTKQGRISFCMQPSTPASPGADCGVAAVTAV